MRIDDFFQESPDSGNPWDSQETELNVELLTQLAQGTAHDPNPLETALSLTRLVCAEYESYGTEKAQVDSTGRRNTLTERVVMGRPAGWLKELTGRNPKISPGAPCSRRSIERALWKKIASGISSEVAAAAVGVLPAVGTRWFRQGGGMPTITLSQPGGRCLSFAEREEIALLRSGGAGVREIARRLGRG